MPKWGYGNSLVRAVKSDLSLSCQVTSQRWIAKVLSSFLNSEHAPKACRGNHLKIGRTLTSFWDFIGSAVPRAMYGRCLCLLRRAFSTKQIAQGSWLSLYVRSFRSLPTLMRTGKADPKLYVPADHGVQARCLWPKPRYLTWRTSRMTALMSAADPTRRELVIRIWGI